MKIALKYANAQNIILSTACNRHQNLVLFAFQLAWISSMESDPAVKAYLVPKADMLDYYGEAKNTGVRKYDILLGK